MWVYALLMILTSLFPTINTDMIAVIVIVDVSYQSD